MAFFFVMQRYLFIPVVCVCILYKKHNKEKHWFLFLNICLSFGGEMAEGEEILLVNVMTSR
jgi:hypothetical protein